MNASSTIVWAAAATVHFTFNLVGSYVRSSRRWGTDVHDKVMTLFVVLKWLDLGALVATFAYCTAVGVTFDFFDGVSFAAQAFIWWILRNGDDEWRKKFKKRVKEKVAQIGARLVVVPVGAT